MMQARKRASLVFLSWNGTVNALLHHEVQECQGVCNIEDRRVRGSETLRTGESEGLQLREQEIQGLCDIEYRTVWGLQHRVQESQRVCT